MLHRLLLPTLAALALVSPAALSRGGPGCPPNTWPFSLTHVDTLPFQPTDWSGALSVPRFHPGPGQTLTQVDILLQCNYDGLLEVTNTGRTVTDIFWSVTADWQAVLPTGPVTQMGSDSGGAFPPLAPGEVRQFVPQIPLPPVAQSYADPASLALFTGPGTVNVPFTSQVTAFFTVLNGAANFLAIHRTDARLQITYTYCQELTQPPVCPDGVQIELWPPNHQHVPLDLQVVAGVVDPQGLPLAIQVDAITQDEPIDAQGGGDGNTVCDGYGIGTGTAYVRAERQGGGNGRVYAVHYTATNAAGLSCSGTLHVSVPHSQNRVPAVDDGQTQDSTVGCP